MPTTISPLKLRSFTNAQPKRSGDVAVSEERLLDFDDLVEYFAALDNREQYTMTEVDEYAAEILVKQLKQYARINKLSTRPEQQGCAVTFRFSPLREKSEDGTASRSELPDLESLNPFSSEA